MSACAPFFKDGFTDENIYGALCMDINPQGDLNKYFDLDSVNDDDNFFMLMNNDPILNSEDFMQ